MNQRFSEEEANAIIQHAAELQARVGGGGDRSSGISLADLKKIAEETGIDPQFIEQALVLPKAKTKSNLLSEEFIFEAPGTFTEEDKTALVDLLREQGVRLQASSTLGSSIATQVVKGTVYGQLTIQSRQGRSKLTFRQIPFIAYFAGLHLPLILSFVCAFPLISKLGVLGAAIDALILTLGVFLFVTFMKMGRKSARELFDNLSREAQQLLLAHPDPNEKASE
jgi:hypothetical protein